MKYCRNARPSVPVAVRVQIPARRRHILGLVALLIATLLPACRTASEHFQSETWGAAFDQMMDKPDQWFPSSVALAATPLLVAIDKSNSLESAEDQFFDTNTSTGDAWALALGFSPIVLGGVAGLTTGDTRHLEATSEAVLLTAAETQLFKLVTDRQRPDGSSGGDSFPSGHTSFSFCGATLLARWWADEHDGSWLGYSLYLPAAYVGISRLEGNRHYLSDITFGAALGMVTAHLVWNLHFGDANHIGLFGRRVDATLAPVVSQEGMGLGLSLSF